MRYVFGPQLLGLLTYTPPAGELPDVVPTATLGAVTASATKGKVDVAVDFGFEPYDPTASHGPSELYAIAFGPGDGIPTDEAKAIASAKPKGSVDASGHTGGGTLSVQIQAVDPGQVTIVTVFGYPDEPTGTAPDPSAPGAPSADPAPGDPSTSAPTS